MPPETSEILLRRVGEASELAREAFAAGDKVTGGAALVMAAQLLRLARLWEKINAHR